MNEVKKNIIHTSFFNAKDEKTAFMLCKHRRRQREARIRRQNPPSEAGFHPPCTHATVPLPPLHQNPSDHGRQLLLLGAVRIRFQADTGRIAPISNTFVHSLLLLLLLSVLQFSGLEHIAAFICMCSRTCLTKNVDGVNYIHVKVAGLLFVATTRVNISPSLVLELLQRIARVIKDYLGVLNEDSLRKNFVLVYELLDEVIDFGYPQTTSTEVLKSYVFNEPIVVEAARLPALGPAAMFMQGTKRMPGTAVTKSVVANEPGGRKREEIFVDVIEKISVTFSSS
ncbi:hypothetical protein Taro_053706, partial [Colocasia esculenta]|nr:hypothetical protein [Colocasia esculenta]